MRNEEEIEQEIIDDIHLRLGDTGVDIRGDKLNVFIDEKIKKAIAFSISSFNELPRFSYYSMRDVYQFKQCVVLHACSTLLSSHALIEKGREYGCIDSGITFEPIPIAEFLAKQAEVLYKQWFDLATYTKSQLEDYPH